MNSKPIKKPGKAGMAVICVLLALALIVNVACGIFYSAITPFMTANLNPLLTGQKQVATGQNLTVEQAAEQSRAMAQELVQEGAVLLKDQNNALPLAEDTAVNLFGYGSVDPIYGGSGSGASDTSSNIDLVTGLTNAGFTVNQELVDFYKNSGVSRAAQKGFEGSNFTPAEVPAAQYTDTLLQNAKAFSDVAIVTISRVGGEGGDLPQDMYAAGYSKTDDGRHYLELTQDATLTSISDKCLSAMVKIYDAKDEDAAKAAEKELKKAFVAATNGKKVAPVAVYIPGTKVTKDALAQAVQKDMSNIQTDLERFGVNKPTKFGVTATKQKDYTLILFMVSE